MEKAQKSASIRKASIDLAYAVSVKDCSSNDIIDMVSLGTIEIWVQLLEIPDTP